MLQSLKIDNFALIDFSEIEFNNGFTIITGETGSGKSILLNALNLILGERANFSVIGNKKEKSIVEAEIDIKGFKLKPFFKKNEIDYFDTTIIRREINKQGRSRAFINDTPVALGVLKSFSSGLIHIHSQYNTLELKDPKYQLNVLDVLSGTLNDVALFKSDFLSFKALKNELENKVNRLNESNAISDYNSFQLNELNELDLDNVDFEALQNELIKVESADDLKLVLSEIVNGLKAEGNTIELLHQLHNLVNRNSKVANVLSGIKERLNSSIIELSDVASDAESQLNDVEIEPQLLLELTTKLDGYNKSLFKHKCDSQQALLIVRDSFLKDSNDLSSLENEIEALKAKIEILESELTIKANELHEHRLKEIPKIEKKIIDTLKELQLEDTRMSFDLIKSDDWSVTGVSKLNILFSPNAGTELVSIHQAASGGELSRLMLALQNLMAKKVKQNTILFDEIDTGVSGSVAHKIALMLKQMGEGMQVIAITHLPQVAAAGGQHLLVSKANVSGITNTSVLELNMEERVEEIARLMSGDLINQAALDNAKALMN